MFYPATWPIGTCHYNKLPVSLQVALAERVTDGILDPSFEIHRTPTEGPYIEFSGYKVRVQLVPTSPTTYDVKLV